MTSRSTTAVSRQPSEPLDLDGTVVVVGAGLAGLRAAETLRREDFRGQLIMIGDEPHRPYDRPPLSKQVLAGTWPPEKAELIDQAKLDQLGLDLRLNRRATSLDAKERRVVLDDGETVVADAVVLATGARPRHLNGTEAMSDVLVLRTIDDALELRRRILELGAGGRVVVIGAGFIGSEVASTCSALGSTVTVVEALPTPLVSVLGPEVGASCATLHETHGVTLLTGSPVAAVRSPDASTDGSGRAGTVHLENGTVLEADVIVVGVGVTPNTEWLEGSSLELGDGVLCDEALFAADGVVAAGDLARWPHRGLGTELRVEHWQVAAEEGAAAARSLLAGRSAAPAFVPVPYFWSDQYNVRLQMLGVPHRDDEVVVATGDLDAHRFVALYGREGRLTAAFAMSLPRPLMAYRPLLASGATWDEALALPLPTSTPS